jgi:hypothetical protein
LLSIVLLVAASSYVWILPLFRPRGPFLWGHYALKDIYLGVPLVLTTLCVILPLDIPLRYRHSFSLRLAVVTISILMTFAFVDAVYAFGVMGAWRADFWLDQAHIPRRYSAADTELGFVRKPHTSWRGFVPDADRFVDYRTDQNGFRNRPAPQRADIVFIGDSFSEAATVAEDETFVRRVSQSTGLSVINLGRGAYGPQQELIVLERYGFLYEPRFVVWQLFEGNDLNDARTFAAWSTGTQQNRVSLKERYLNNSLVAAWLNNTISKDSITPVATLRYHDGTARRLSLRYSYEPEEPAENPLGLSETINAIEAGQRLCETRGIQLLVVSIPTMVRVMAPNLSFDRAEDEEFYLPERKPGQKDFSDNVAELCARIGCSFVDGFTALRQAAAKGNTNLYIPNDEHFDLGGHEVMAQIVEDWLRSSASGLTPPEQ